MNNASNQEKSYSADTMDERQEFAKLLKILVRCKWWFIIPLSCISALSLVIALVLPDIFMSKATILIENQSIPQVFVSSPVTSYAEQRIQTITQEVMSRSRILSLMRKYDLFSQKRKYLSIDTLIEKIRHRIAIETINAEIHHQEQNRPTLLTIAFSLSFQDEDPRKAQAVANEISSYYLEKNLESREKHIQSTTKFLDEQLKDTKGELDNLQRQIAEFRQEHLEELPDFMNFNIQKIEKLNNELRSITIEIRSLENQKIPLKHRIALLNPHESGRTISPRERLTQLELERAQLLSQYSGKHPLVKANMRETAILNEKRQTQTLPGSGQTLDNQAQDNQTLDRLKELEIKLIELKSQYSPQHPSVKELTKEIDTLQDEFQKSQQQTDVDTSEDLEATNPSYVALKAELERIDMSIASLEVEKLDLEKMAQDIEEKLRTMPSVAARFNELDRDYQSAKMHYNEIMEKLLSARISQGMEEEQLGERFTVVEPAFLPDKPYKPNRILIMVLGVLIGCGLAIFLVTLHEFTDENIRDCNTLEAITGIPVLASISAMKTPKEIARARRTKVVLTIAILCAFVIALYMVHRYVIDFYVLYSELVRFFKAHSLV
ncbi:MAG: GNVR domain-containing protein [bacterium]